MADKLTFSGMTWDILENKYGIGIGDALLFEGCPPVKPTPILVGYLDRARRVRLANERARAHRLVDPVLSEIEALYDGKISTIPEMYLEVKDMEGLSGNPDFIISAGPVNKVIPIVAIVEAKKDDTDPGLPQCAAELYAAYLYDKGRINRLYGCVTTGWDWRFMYFDGAEKQLVIDRTLYFTFDLPPLLGALKYVVDKALEALALT